MRASACLNRLPHQELLVSIPGDAGCVKQVFINGADAFVRQLAVDHGGAVNLGFEEGSEHGVSGILFFSRNEVPV